MKVSNEENSSMFTFGTAIGPAPENKFSFKAQPTEFIWRLKNITDVARCHKTNKALSINRSSYKI